MYLATANLMTIAFIFHFKRKKNSLNLFFLLYFDNFDIFIRKFCQLISRLLKIFVVLNFFFNVEKPNQIFVYPISLFSR